MFSLMMDKIIISRIEPFIHERKKYQGKCSQIYIILIELKFYLKHDFHNHQSFIKLVSLN
jgi:hypothetical protein